MRSALLPEIGQKTCVMGIINLTPDSFSGDGLIHNGDYTQPALAQARRFVEEDADLLDLGAESTRPGSSPVSADEEIARLLPVLRRLREELPDVLLSIDTCKSATAEACLAAGAQIINDIWGFQHDALMPGVVAGRGATAILMHNRLSGARPVTSELGGRYEDVVYEDIVTEVSQWLSHSVSLAHQAGLQDDQIILDPGIGFGKTINQNLFLLKHLDRLAGLGFPILLGVSRKGFIGHTLNLPVGERLEGSLAAAAYGILHGADIVRVHDVKETVRLARMLDAIRYAQG